MQGLLVLSGVMFVSVAALVVKNGLRDDSTIGAGGMPRNHGQVWAGAEWQLILFVSAGCVPSNDAHLPEAVRAIAWAFNDQARAVGESFTTVGVATDDRPRNARRILGRFGEFDEVSLGRGWRNLVVLQHMIRDTASSPATPTLIVLRRSMEVATHGGYTIGRDSLILRVSGVEPILEFSRWLTPRGGGSQRPAQDDSTHRRPDVTSPLVEKS